jgi:hypothetical protein
MQVGGLIPGDSDVEGIVEAMPNATKRFDQPRTEDHLQGWHAVLFPTGRSGMTGVRVGQQHDD